LHNVGKISGDTLNDVLVKIHCENFNALLYQPARKSLTESTKPNNEHSTSVGSIMSGWVKC
jgi:hypothetical protein